jgi:hypothetical protein
LSTPKLNLLIQNPILVDSRLVCSILLCNHNLNYIEMDNAVIICTNKPDEEHATFRNFQLILLIAFFIIFVSPQYAVSEPQYEVYKVSSLCQTPTAEEITGVAYDVNDHDWIVLLGHGFSPEDHKPFIIEGLSEFLEKDDVNPHAGFDGYEVQDGIAINNAGYLCGTMFKTPHTETDPANIGFFFNGSSVQNLLPLNHDDLAANQQAWASDLNVNEMIVGYGSYRGPTWSNPEAQALFNRRATKWQSGGQATQLEIYPGYYESQAMAINDAGTTVGVCEWPSGEFDGIPWGVQVVWQGSSPTEICEGSATIGPTAKPYDINDSGWVVGNRILDVSSTDAQRAYLWRDGSITDIHPLPAGAEYESFAIGVNDTGQIVGYGTIYGLFPQVFLWENDTIYFIDSLLVNSGSPMQYENDSTDYVLPGCIPIAISSNGDILTTTCSEQTTYNYYRRVDREIPDIVMNSTGDDSDNDLDDDICWTGNLTPEGHKECTFRAAIEHSNAKSGPNNILFDIPGSGIPVIEPNSNLPDITDTVFIDATSQPGQGLVILDGHNIGSSPLLHVEQNDAALTLTAGNSVIQGLVINNFPGNGITITSGDSNRISQTMIGTNADTVQDLGNGGHGIYIDGSSYNLIGSVSAGYENVICFNDKAGVYVSGNAVGNAIRWNVIYANKGLGIDLAPEGVTPNDPDDVDTGPNNLQNFPVIDSAVGDFADPLIYGTVTGNPYGTILVEIFANDVFDSSSYGEGRIPMVTKMVSMGSSDSVTFNVQLGDSLREGQYLSATAIDEAGNTSEFSRCWPKTIKLLDDSSHVIKNREFVLYQVANDPPTFTETLVDTIKTDSAGQFPLYSTRLPADSAFCVRKMVNSALSPKRSISPRNAYMTYLDNASFDSVTFDMSYSQVDTSFVQDVTLNHTCVNVNLMVSIEWDASTTYINGLQQVFRESSNYLYDVFDGQLRFDTVMIYDNKEHWDEANVHVFAANTQWQTAHVTGLIRDYGNLSLSRKPLGTKDLQRNNSDNPVNPYSVSAMRVLGHEIGHFVPGFYDEYVYVSGSRCPRSFVSLYGFMEDPYANRGQRTTEMSWDTIYDFITCRNTKQYVENRSCWDYFEFGYEYTYDSVYAAIIKPSERYLAPGRVFMYGPNDYQTPLNYNVGALIKFPQTHGPPAATNTKLTVVNSNLGTRVSHAAVLQSQPSKQRVVMQGHTSDSGTIIALGVLPGDVFTSSVPWNRVAPAMLSKSYSANEYEWYYGSGVFDGTSDYTLELTEVYGAYPLIVNTQVFADDIEIKLTPENQFSANPTLDMLTEAEADFNYTFSFDGADYSSLVTDDPAEYGLMTIRAVDDSSNTFFFDADYSLTSLELDDTISAIYPPQGDAQVLVDKLNDELERVILLSTNYPVIRTGLSDDARQAGRSHVLSMYPSTTLSGDNHIGIRYSESELVGGSGYYGDEQSLQVYRWNETGNTWVLFGGLVDTSRNEVSVLIAEPGVYAAFTTETVPDNIPPKPTIGILQNPLLPDYIEIYILADEVLLNTPILMANSSSLELTVSSGETTQMYSAQYQLSGQDEVSLRAIVTDLASNVTDTTITFESYPAGLYGGAWISKDGQLQFIIPDNMLDHEQYILLFNGYNDDGSTYYDLRPHNLRLKQKAKLQLNIGKNISDNEQFGNLVIARQNSDGTWESLPTEIDTIGRSLAAEIDRLGVFRIQYGSSQNSSLPETPFLGQNIPNPFNSSTSIAFILPKTILVRLEVINLLGQRVATLVDEELIAGQHTVLWDGRDNAGRNLASGIYFYRLKTGSYSQTKKMILLK